MLSNAGMALKSTVQIMLVSIAAAGIIIPFASCSYAIGESNRNHTVTDGWIDNDTFQITSSGSPARGTIVLLQRKEGSKRDAILAARMKIIRIFKRSAVKSRSGLESFDRSGKDMPLELETIVKNGHILEETWHENQDCDIVYVVHARNLKNMVRAADWDQ